MDSWLRSFRKGATVKHSALPRMMEGLRLYPAYELTSSVDAGFFKRHETPGSDTGHILSQRQQGSRALL